MRTTLNLDDNLMQAVKLRAAETGRTVTEMTESALRELLRNETKPQTQYRLRLKTVKGTGPPRVDLDDRNALIDFLDGRE
ncbi:MAG: type II toxin-antitoxin system VapB family antitoxin [Acidobacteria bacterium]|nr:type II toxin-antitoxin system VapB family antitoxin [Acidobacteriota bacterium]